LIKKKLEAISETEGFGIMEIANSFRSQRCSECGWTQKSNRKSKLFICNHCGFATDADLNASFNLEDDSLYAIPKQARLDKINRTGFFWNSEGLMNLSREFIVPYVNIN
jgi:transposase